MTAPPRIYKNCIDDHGINNEAACLQRGQLASIDTSSSGKRRLASPSAERTSTSAEQPPPSSRRAPNTALRGAAAAW
jgi:hypothetical protein